MKPPAPCYGNKAAASSLIWAALGDVPNYVEPFSGMAGNLFARPGHDFRDRVETINDADGLVANALRGIKLAPEAVVEHADRAVVEVDLIAVHQLLVASARDGSLVAKLSADLDYCDPRLAGLWLWARSCWFGRGFCHDPPPHHIPHLSGGGGVGKGYGQGIHRGDMRYRLREYMVEAATRLRFVRIVCGDWTRVVTPVVTVAHGRTGVLLDTPYGVGVTYAHGGDDTALLMAARDWAIANGDNVLLAIVLCCYDAQITMPDGWRCVPWKARSTRGDSKPERLWLSPHCIHTPQPRQGTLL